jgi:hypothetical protein
MTAILTEAGASRAAGPGAPGWGSDHPAGRDDAAAAVAIAQLHWRLAAALSATGQMRVSWDGGRTYPARRERPISPRPPPQPTTIPVYDRERGTGQLLACDFDVGRARAAGAADPLARVAADAGHLASLVERLGGTSIQDLSPAGGRHLYVLWAIPQPWLELKQLAAGLARRYPSLDTSPMASITGQIRPPGSRYKSVGGRSPGWQVLTVSLASALAAAATPCGAPVWNALLAEFAAELAAVTADSYPVSAGPPAPVTVSRDTAGVPWLPRPGGPFPLRPDLLHIAETGSYRQTRYPSGSEARQAILCCAAARGWSLDDVTTAMTRGGWPGLARLYTRYASTSRPGAIRRDWQKAVTRITRKTSSPISHIKENYSHPPAMGLTDRDVRDLSALNVYQQIRIWENARWLAERDSERRAGWGRAAVSIRLALRALGAAAQMAGSLEVEFGCRDLALIAKVSYRTMADALRAIRADDDPLALCVRRGQGLRADRYRLRIPDAYAEDAAWRRWRSGKVEPVHRVFRVLGGAAALVYEALAADPATTAEIQRFAVLSATAADRALRLLGEHGLAERHRGGWCRGPVMLDEAAAATGADALEGEIRRAYVSQRDSWWGYLTGPDLPSASEPGVQRYPARMRGSGVGRLAVSRGPPAGAERFDEALQIVGDLLGARPLRATG